MELKDLVSVVVGSLVAIVLAHVGAYYVVKSLYPPTPSVVPPPPVVFTQPPVVEQQQHVVVPTYEAPVPAQAPREEGERRGPPPPESTSIHGNSGLATANAQ